MDQKEKRALEGVKVGDVLVASDVNAKGSTWPVKVDKVGRSLIHVSTIGKFCHVTVYRIDTGRSNDARGNGYVMTREAHELEKRNSAADCELRGIGIDIHWSSKARSRAAEILDAVKAIMEKQ